MGTSPALAGQFMLSMLGFFVALSLIIKSAHGDGGGYGGDDGGGSGTAPTAAMQEPERPSFVCPSYIYAFGDSYTDTGNFQALSATMLNQPYGESYCFPDRPKERTRNSNGRLVVDFITQAFKFPFIEPYSRHFGDQAYRRGVNFAISTGTATTVYGVPGTAFTLDRETRDYLEFRDTHSGSLYDAASALHIIPEIGGNDFVNAYITGQTAEMAIATVVPAVLKAVVENIEQYYARGARSIVIFNIPPGGCTPVVLTILAGRGPYDEYGCLMNYNAAIEAYNDALNATVHEHRKKWRDADLFLFDFYAAAYEIIRNTDKYGFLNKMITQACCGCCGPYNYNPLVPCGTAGYVDDNRTIFADNTQACADPDRYIIWDGEHSTQAFYRVIARFFLTGRFVDAPHGFSSWNQHCDLDFSQWDDFGDGREEHRKCDTDHADSINSPMTPSPSPAF